MATPSPSIQDSPQQSSPSVQDPSPSSSTFSFVRLEQVAKVVAAVAVLLYAFGLLVSNEYLLTWGITDFNSLRPKYVLTGAWAVLLLVAAAMPVLAPLSMAQHRDISSFQTWLILIASAIVGTGLAFVGLVSIFAPLMDKLPTISDQIKFIGLACSIAGLAAVVYSHLRERGSKPIRLFLCSLLLLLLLLDSAYYIGRNYYGEIAEGLGGGKPIFATLILNKDGARLWKQLGAETVGGDEETVRSDVVAVLYQNDHDIVVVFHKKGNAEPKPPGEWVIVNKALVNGLTCTCASVHY